MNITGGTITNNHAYIIGGGLQVYRQSTAYTSIVYLKNGIVFNNTSPNGANINATNGAQVIYN